MKNKTKYLGGSREGWNIYPRILQIANLGPNKKILDAGCGEGLLMECFNGKNVFGIDLNPDNVEEARRKSYQKVIIGNLKNLPYKNKEFDETICIETIQFIGEPEKAFRELLRITKGKIILTSPNHNFSSIRSLFKFGRLGFIQLLQNRQVFFVNQYLFERLAKKNNLDLEMKYVSKTLGFIRDLKLLGNLFGGEIVGIFKSRMND